MFETYREFPNEKEMETNVALGKMKVYLWMCKKLLTVKDVVVDRKVQLQEFNAFECVAPEYT
jgi:hypothetical protein